MEKIEVFAPTAVSRTQSMPLATRSPALAGARIGWLDNMKANASELLHELSNAFSRQGFQLENIRQSKNATVAASTSVIAHLETCDAVVLAIAD